MNVQNCKKILQLTVIVDKFSNFLNNPKISQIFRKILS